MAGGKLGPRDMDTELEKESEVLVNYITIALAEFISDLKPNYTGKNLSQHLMTKLNQRFGVTSGSLLHMHSFKKFLNMFNEGKDLNNISEEIKTIQFGIPGLIAIDSLLYQYTSKRFLNRNIITNMSLAASMATYKKLYCILPSLPEKTANIKKREHIPYHDMFAAYKIRTSVFNEVKDSNGPEYILKDYFKENKEGAKEFVEKIEASDEFKDSACVIIGSEANNMLVPPLLKKLIPVNCLNTDFNGNNRKIRFRFKVEKKIKDTDFSENLAIILMSKLKNENRMITVLFGATRELTEKVGSKISEVHDVYFKKKNYKKNLRSILYVFEWNEKDRELSLLKNYGTWPKVFEW